MRKLYVLIMKTRSAWWKGLTKWNWWNDWCDGGHEEKTHKKTGAPFHSSPSLFNSIQITSKCLTYFTFSISILITKCVISMTAKFYFS